MIFLVNTKIPFGIANSTRWDLKGKRIPQPLAV